VDPGRGNEHRHWRSDEKRARHHRRGSRRKPRRLGAVEYTLLALIVVCVAVTIVLAIVNPGS
jgi:hypothetical protein